MANLKADKINFIGNGNPPLLNLTKNKSHVYTNFKSVEENNAPYINEMLQPLWKNTITGDSVFDKFNNRYYIKEGSLYRNDENLGSIATKKFVREDVTDEFGGYLAFDLHQNKISYLELTSTNTIKWHQLDETVYETPQLFVTGEIICSRIRALDYYEVAVVVYKNQLNQLKVAIATRKYSENNTVLQHNGIIQWKSTIITNGIQTEPTINNIDVNRCYPLINICQLYNPERFVGISLVSNYDKTSISNTNSAEFQDGIATYFIDFQTYGFRIYGSGSADTNFMPYMQSTYEETTTDYSVYCNFRKYYQQSASVSACIYDSNSGKYYEYENSTKGEEITFNTEYPTRLGQYVEIDGVTYEICNYNIFQS